MKSSTCPWLWLPLAIACLVVNGCESLDPRVDKAENEWFANTFPNGMSLEEFKAIVPDAHLVDEQMSGLEYRALVARVCFTVCRTMDGGLRSRDILPARFVFQDGRLIVAERVNSD